MPDPLNRREFLRTATCTGAGLLILSSPQSLRGTPANDRLNIAAIGVGGRGAANLDGVAGENIVALCDVDQEQAAAAYARFPQARRYRDFRRMFDEMADQIDAVVISTPDHVHAAAGLWAMRLGKHCYCEKPLAYSVHEARAMAQLSEEKKLVTQMGTQIHAGTNYRRVVELVQTGAIGTIRDVHVWLGADFSGPPLPTDRSQPDAPTGTPDVPDTLDWDLWLGPAAYRPYNPGYLPGAWRYWWNFGNGQLGDFYCHYCDLPFWALGLKHPVTIEATGPIHPESTARWTIARQTFPARGPLPPVGLHWYHGGAHPDFITEKAIPQWGNAVLFVGSLGMLIADYDRHLLLPEDAFIDHVPPSPYIPPSIGHHREWIEACKTGSATTCPFAYSGALTEAALLCNVALRTGRRLTWDAANLEAIDCPEANALLRRTNRESW
jgi:predicted dehydrogenase